MNKVQEIQVKERVKDPTVNIALDTISIGKQALIFTNSKRSAEKTAEDISRKTRLSTAGERTCMEISEQLLKVLSSPTKQCRRLAACVKKGVAFHHAGLTHKQKDIIEYNFRKGNIKIIAATPTLAAGVDLPSFRTVLKDLRRFSGPRGMTWIPVLEYEQMAGRSGRPSYDNYGEAIALASTTADKDKIYKNYICGKPEEIYSKLAVEPVLRTYLLSLIATGFVATKSQILDFFGKTFWAYQFEDMQRLESIIMKMLDLLDDFGFITRSDVSKSSEFVSAADIADGKINATQLGERVAKLYIDPLTAYEIIACLKRAKDKLLDGFSFIHMVCSRLEMRPYLRVKTSEYDLMQRELARYEDNLLDIEPDLYDPDYDDFLNSVKTALFMRDWIDELTEEQLLERYNIRPGEIKMKLDRADWLLYSAEELAKLLKMQPILKEVSKTRFRLRYGVKEELLPLLKLEGVGRVRARKLYQNRMHNLGDIKSADAITLAQIVGKATALKIKEQLGQAVDKNIIPERKRKGQISLKDY